MKQSILVSDIISALGSQFICISSDIINPLSIGVDNLAEASKVTESTLDWINTIRKNKQSIAQLSKAKVLLVDDSITNIPGKVLIKVKNPKTAIALVGNKFFIDKPSSGTHPSAVIHPDAKIGKDVFIGAFVVIGKCVIGDGSIISSFVKIYDNVEIGTNCKIKEGAVIGGEGFGFQRDENGNLFRFPQIGGVRIGNNVEIGANTCIDRGALSDTIIEDYVKIDNLCQIAHNVHIGKNTIITAGAVVAGSSKIGHDCWIGINSTIKDQTKIGSNVTIGMGALIAKPTGDNEVWANNIAKVIS